MTPENINSNEKSIEKSKDKKKIDKNILIKEFVLESVNNDKISFLEDIFKYDIFDGKIKKDLSDFITKKSSSNESLLNDNKYTNFDLSTIKIDDIKLESKKYLIPLDTKRKNIESILKEEFILKEKKDIDNISNLIKKQSELKLNDLLKSQKQRIDFIKSYSQDIKIIEKSLDSFLDIDKNNLSTDAISVIDTIQNKFNKGLKITSFDISSLLNEVEFSIDDKRKIIHSFIPTISMENAIKWGIKDKNDSKTYKKALSKAYEIDDSKIDDFISSIDDKDLILSTKLNCDLAFQIDQIIKNSYFTNISDFLNDFIEKTNTKIKQEGPQDLEGFKKELLKNNTNNRFDDLKKFLQGNFMELQKKDETGKVISSQYIKIKKADDEKKEFSFLVVGNDKTINTNLEGEGKNISYSDFLSNMKKTNSNMYCFDKKDIEQKIKDPTNPLGESELKLFDLNDLKNKEDKEKYSNYYKQKLEEELEELKKELEENKDSALLKARLEEKKQKLEDLNKIGDNRDDNELLNFLNFEKFIEKLDEIDTDGKKVGFKKGMFIESKGGIYKVTGINELKTIDLESKAGKEYGISLDIFFNAFKENKAKRLEAILNFSSLIESKNNDEKWKNHEIKDGKIIAKNSEHLGESKDRKVEFLVSDDNDDLLKINDISGDTVRVQFGSRKDYSDLEDKNEKEKYKGKEGEIIYLDSNEITLNLNELDSYISEKKLHPNWKTGKQVQKSNPEDPKNDFKASFWSRYFDRISINEVLAGGTMLIDSFKESMKTGNDLHAAKVALAMGSFLPGDIKSDLTIKVERAEAEEMDKALDGLGKVDSPIAVGRIKKWLLNKDTREYRKEAAIMFMLSKYGHLTAKGPLYEFRGKYLWYEALGGKINDDLFIEIKEETEKANITFDEEYLIHMLLKRQCNGILKPKRRSRLHKEYEAKWKSGVQEEYDKGYGDAEKKRNATDMILGGNDEATGGTTSNAIGWYKKALERGDSLENMSEGFFALLYSGCLYGVSQATFLKIQDLWSGEGKPMIFARFSSKKSDMELFNNTVLELSKRIADIYSDEFPYIGTEASSLFKDAHTGEGNEKDRFNKSIEFWKKYGKILSRSLNFVNSKEEKYSKTDKIILFEKENNSIFKDYYDNVKAFTGELDFKKDYMTDSFRGSGITGLNTYQVARKTLKMHVGGGFIEDENGKTNWKELSDDIYSVKNKIFDIDSSSIDTEANKKLQKEYLKSILKDIISAFVENSGGNENAMAAYNMLTTDIGYDLTKWGIDLFKDFGKLSSSRIMQGEADDIFSEVADNILLGNLKDINDSFNDNPFDEIISGTKSATDHTINEEEK